MISDSKNGKRRKNCGKTKASPGFPASVNTEFSSKKNGIWNFHPFRLEKDFSKQLLGEFNETNFENPCFSWEINFAKYKINEIFPPQKFLLLLSFHILCSIAVTEK